MMRRLAASVLLAFLAACQETPVDTPERNLERCTGLVQFCVEPEAPDSSTYQVRPAGWCSGQDCAPGDQDCLERRDSRRLLGAILESARGEVALADLDGSRLLDLGGGQPGYSVVPVGAAPRDLASSPDGCLSVVTAGDCRLTLLDHTALVDLAGVETQGAVRPLLTRLSLWTDSGRLLATPSEVAVADVRYPPAASCQDLVDRSAYVTLPSCGLLAEVDLETGRILQSVRVSGQGIEDAGTDPVCPADCPDVAGDGAVGGARSRELPTHLAYYSVSETGRRPEVLVAPQRGDWVALVPLVPAGDFDLSDARILHLDPGRNGVSGIRRLRVLGPTPLNDLLFAYVVTSDGDVRVLDLDQEQECETNPDPRDPYFQGQDWYREGFSCLPIGSVARAPLSDGPGIQLPDGRQAVDVAWATVDATDLPEDVELLAPQRMVGSFAYILSRDGQVFVSSLDEDFTSPDENHNGLPDLLEHRLQDGAYAVLSHQLRNATDTREQEDGRPRVEDYTYLKGGEVVEEPPAGITVSEVDVTDPRSAVAETWSLVYEGALPRATGTAGFVYKPYPANDDPESADFRDDTARFCEAGVRPGDILVLKGCDSDSDCSEGFSCLHDVQHRNTNGGICVDSRYVLDQTLVRACLPFVEGRRDYEVAQAYEHRLVVRSMPAPGTPCDTAADCATDAGSSIQCEDGLCVGDCSQDEGACAALGGVCEGGRCIRAPLPDRRVEIGQGVTWCLPSLLQYEVRVRDAFLVLGSATGTLERRTEDHTGRCVDDDSLSPLYRARIPLGAETFENPVFRIVLTGTDPHHPPGRDDGIRFEILGGYNPMRADLGLKIPAAILSGADGYVYVLDMGDDTDTQGGVTGLVLRIDPATFGLDDSFLLR